jgi:BirA family transcriptional regulator, biotin operon repressor / biotin---[acetyl-CoA-carboxylase] ligase
VNSQPDGSGAPSDPEPGAPQGPEYPPPATRPALDATALRKILIAGDGLWSTLDVVEETGSTNADLAAAVRRAAAAEGGAPLEGAVLAAEHQHAGRGRSGRTWSSAPRAGIAVSVLLRPGAGVGGGAGAGHRPPVPVTRWSWLPLLAGVALSEAVAGVTDLAASLKWPNDLLIGGRKCAGILAEIVDEAVVLGIGVNVTQTAAELPPAAAGAVPATSLTLAGARRADRQVLLAALLRRIESWYACWRATAGDPDASGLRAAYLAASATVGQPVRVLLPGGDELTGAASAVDTDGRLVLRTDDGGTVPVAAGDVTHVRAG